MKNLLTIALLGLVLTLTEQISHNILAVRILNVSLMIVLLFAQFVVYATTLDRPEWYLRCQRVAMAATLFGTVIIIWLPDTEGVYLGGQVIRIGLTQLMVATAVYRYMADNHGATQYIRQRWYYPAMLLLAVAGVFVFSEQYRDNQALQIQYNKLLISKADSTSKTTKKTLSLTRKNQSTLKGDSLAGAERTAMLRELSEQVDEVHGPMLTMLRDIKAEQTRQRIWMQQQEVRTLKNH